MFDLKTGMQKFAGEYASIEEMAAWARAVMESREPDFVIGGNYMRRWFIIPRNALQNVYLHRVLRSDDDRALHDHPWSNVSLLIEGRYREITPEGEFLREPGEVIAREATARHRLELIDGPVTSLFLTGPKVRDWGFWCGADGERFVPWEEFVDPDNRGAVGPGCGEN